MNAVLKYLTFVGFLAAASYAAATFDVTSNLPAGAQKTLLPAKSAPVPSLSNKPAHLLGGLQGQVQVEYGAVRNLTIAGAADTVRVWQLPDENPKLEIDTADGFSVRALRYIAGKELLAVGGSSADGATGGVRLFDARSGKMVLQLDEVEPISFLDLHPGGGFLLATARSYLKVIAVKDGETVALLPKESPIARGYFYGGGSTVLLTDSLALFDMNTQKKTAELDTVAPLLVRKNGASGRISWLTGTGLASQATLNGSKEFVPLHTQGVIAFDREPNGTWGLFLLEDQKLLTVDLATGTILKTVKLASPAVDVSINPDGSSASVVYAGGDIAVFDIGSANIAKNIRYKLAKTARAVGENITALISRLQR